jgi:ferredoxin-nitrite reductase
MQGIEGFRSEVVKKNAPSIARESSEDLIQKQWERRGYFGVHSQKQEGFRLLAT